MNRKISWGEKLGCFLADKWPWLVLAAAAIFFAHSYMPQLCMGLLDSDMVLLPVFYQDIVVLHHPASDWYWGGYSTLFPDVTVFFLLNFLSGSGWFALKATMVFIFLGWLAGGAALTAAFRRTDARVVVSLMSIFIVYAACGEQTLSVYQQGCFEPIFHSGTSILCLASAALLIAQVQGGGWLGFGGFFVLVFLGSTSDILFLVDFVGPALVALAVLIAGFPASRSRYAILFMGVGVAGAAGYKLAPICFPPVLVTDRYMVPDVQDTVILMTRVWSDAMAPGNYVYGTMVALDVIFVAATILSPLLFFSARFRNWVSPALVAGVVLGAAAICLNWGAVLTTGRYVSMAGCRYLIVALFVPLFVLALALPALVRWPRWVQNIVLLLVSGWIMNCAFLTKAPSSSYYSAMSEAPFVLDLMRKNHITDGLAEYWDANLFTVVTNGAIRFRTIDGGGQIFPLGNTLSWYGKNMPIHDGPHFRLVWRPEPASMAGRYGLPDQVITTPGQNTIWLYSDARSIRYNDYFGVLTGSLTDDAHTWSIDAAKLPGRTGEIIGNSRIGTAGTDHEDYLTYGPYIRLKPGRYRATYRFTYLAPPAPDQISHYALVLEGDKGGELLHSVPLPYVAAQPQTVSDDFTVTRPNSRYQMQIFFQGTGTLRVDSLSVTCLEP